MDPVDLWANPTSQSRVEKDYFDSRFGPFYRTNQIFIKPLNQDHVSEFVGIKCLMYFQLRFFSRFFTTIPE